MAVDGDAADLVSDARCGVTAQSENPESLVMAVDSLLAAAPEERMAMSENGTRYYRDNMSLEKGAYAFASIFYRLARLKKR